MEMQNLPSRVLSFSRSVSSMRSYDKLDQHRVPKSPISDEAVYESHRRRCFLASLCCIFALIATITLGTVLAVRAHSNHRSSDSSDDQSLSSGSAAIAAACNTTMFPDLCYQWLSAEPGSLTASPLGLVGISIKVALKHVHEASTLASELHLSSQQVSMTKQAIKDCVELMDLSTDQLNDSSNGLSSISLLSIKSSLSNVKVELSGTMGFQLACSEGLAALSESDNSTMTLLDSQDKVGKGVIISLGLVDSLSKLGNRLSSWKNTLPNIHFGRNLVSDEGRAMEGDGFSEYTPETFSSSEDNYFPKWLSAADRKLLQTPPPTTLSSTPLSHPTPLSMAPPPGMPSATPPHLATPSVTAPLPNSSVGMPPTTPTTSSTGATPPIVSPVLTPSVKPSISSSPSTQTAGTPVAYDAIVAQDGSGTYKTIQDALNNVPVKRSTRYTIYIKKGEYKEYVSIPKSMKLLTLIGDGMGQTIITGSKSNAQSITTYNSATVAVSGANFIARKITFRNTAGPSGHQAVALRVNADQAVFDSCSFEGYQDTLYALANRQFYINCNIYGTVDFIFGNAIAVFQNCNVLGRQPLESQQNTFTAQGRKVSSDISGYSFHKCKVGGAPDVLSSAYPVTSYFGRPWQAYSRTVFMQCTIDGIIDPAGWVAWNATNPFTDTLYYGEYQNTGAGAGTSKRVAWKGVHPAMSQQEASSFTVGEFISGDTWLPEAQVAFQQSLS